MQAKSRRAVEKGPSKARASDVMASEARYRASDASTGEHEAVERRDNENRATWAKARGKLPSIFPKGSRQRWPGSMPRIRL